MMYRFYRWYDRQPNSNRFLIFMAMMVLLLFTPSIVWLIMSFTPYAFSPIYVQIAELALLLPVLASRMIYVYGWCRPRRREHKRS